MREKTVLALVFLCGLGLSCGGKSPGAPRVDSRLEVFVHWGDQGLADRRLEIVEQGMVRLTDSTGIAEFVLPAGTYTLRAYVNVGGPAGHTDLVVVTRPGGTMHVEVVDCLPCVSPR